VGVPSLYRIHEKPDAKRVYDFETIAATFGYSLGVGALAVRRVQLRSDRRMRHQSGRNPREIEIPEEVNVTPRMYQKLTEKIAGKPEERILSYLMLRSLKQAKYSEENIGHFGLASDSYTHFTSPIRRYPDLVVHRILKASMSRRTEPAVPAAQLEAIASESSERERQADQAERELLEWKKMLLMEQRLGETFDAIIIGVWRDGFAIELIDFFIEGFVPVADIPDDYYQLDANLHALIGRHTKQRYRIGDRIPVQVVRVDKLLRRAYFLPLGRARGLAGKERSR